MPDTGARYPWPIILVTVFVVSGVLWLRPENLPSIEYLGYALRTTAWLAFALFLLAYVARPLRQLTGLGQSLVRNRRYLGLAAALVHTIHFGYVVAFLRASDDALGIEVVLFGGLAFVLLWIMALTSNNTSIRVMGANWKRVHAFGMHYIWLIFMQTFFFNLGQSALGPVLFGAGLLALMLRVAAYLQRRRLATTDPSG